MEREEASRLARLVAKLLSFFPVRSCPAQTLTGVTFTEIPFAGRTIRLQFRPRRQLSARTAPCSRHASIARWWTLAGCSSLGQEVRLRWGTGSGGWWWWGLHGPLQECVVNASTLRMSQNSVLMFSAAAERLLLPLLAAGSTHCLYTKGNELSGARR